MKGQSRADGSHRLQTPSCGPGSDVTATHRATSGLGRWGGVSAVNEVARRGRSAPRPAAASPEVSPLERLRTQMTSPGLFGWTVWSWPRCHHRTQRPFGSDSLTYRRPERMWLWCYLPRDSEGCQFSENLLLSFSVEGNAQTVSLDTVVTVVSPECMHRPDTAHAVCSVCRGPG